jgi:hypothetical protein
LKKTETNWFIEIDYSNSTYQTYSPSLTTTGAGGVTLTATNDARWRYARPGKAEVVVDVGFTLTAATGNIVSVSMPVSAVSSLPSLSGNGYILEPTETIQEQGVWLPFTGTGALSVRKAAGGAWTAGTGGRIYFAGEYNVP